jgi:hypothetical protein
VRLHYCPLAYEVVQRVNAHGPCQTPLEHGLFFFFFFFFFSFFLSFSFFLYTGIWPRTRKCAWIHSTGAPWHMRWCSAWTHMDHVRPHSGMGTYRVMLFCCVSPSSIRNSPIMVHISRCSNYRISNYASVSGIIFFYYYNYLFLIFNGLKMIGPRCSMEKVSPQSISQHTGQQRRDKGAGGMWSRFFRLTILVSF